MLHNFKFLNTPQFLSSSQVLLHNINAYKDELDLNSDCQEHETELLIF